MVAILLEESNFWQIFWDIVSALCTFAAVIITLRTIFYSKQDERKNVYIILSKIKSNFNCFFEKKVLDILYKTTKENELLLKETIIQLEQLEIQFSFLFNTECFRAFYDFKADVSSFQKDFKQHTYGEGTIVHCKKLYEKMNKDYSVLKNAIEKQIKKKFLGFIP